MRFHDLTWPLLREVSRDGTVVVAALAQTQQFAVQPLEQVAAALGAARRRCGLGEPAGGVAGHRVPRMVAMAASA